MQKKAKKAPKEIGGAIEDTIKSIQTKFGEGAIMKLGDAPKVDIDVIPTGLASMTGAGSVVASGAFTSCGFTSSLVVSSADALKLITLAVFAVAVFSTIVIVGMTSCAFCAAEFDFMLFVN
jgi:hypothetical protein